MPAVLPLCFLDFESRSRADLKAVGGRRYWEHPSSDALCAVLHYQDTGVSDVWLPDEPAPDLAGYRLAAHNGLLFDRFAAARCWDRRLGKAARWVDTSELAKRLGLKGSLAALGIKDSEGSKITRALSVVRKPKGFPADAWRKLTRQEKRERGVLPDVTAEILERVVEYCVADVEALVQAWEGIRGAEGVDSDAGAVSTTINDRGIAFDVDVASLLLAKAHELGEISLVHEANTMLMDPAELGAIVRSPARLADALGAENAQKNTIDALADDKGDAGCFARARQATSSIVGGKLAAGLTRVSGDGRLRDMHRYYGAHTGRWSGVGIQLQNMPRPSDTYEGWDDDQIEGLIGEILARPATRQELEVLLRACVTAAEGSTLIAADWSGIEARMLAWLAHDLDALDVFRSGRKVYAVMASAIFNEPYESIGKGAKYAVGKIAELALGYGQGHRKFGETVAQFGSDLEALGVSAADVVRKWRRLHAPIVRFWNALEAAFREAHTNGEASVGLTDDVAFVRDGQDLVMLLPSGRPLYYPSARVHSTGDLEYESTRGRSHLYGGKLAENATQAACRDLLALGLVGAERAGLRPVMHVHDEIVCEVPLTRGKRDYGRLTQIMLTLPDWARDSMNDRGDFPVAVSGWVGRRYRK